MAKAKIREIEGFEKLVGLFTGHKARSAEEKASQDTAKLKLIQVAEEEIGPKEKSIRFEGRDGGSLTVTRKEELPEVEEETATKLIQLTGARYLVESKTKTTHRLILENAQKFLEEDHTDHPKLAKAQEMVREHLAKTEEKWSIKEERPKAVKGAA